MDILTRLQSGELSVQKAEKLIETRGLASLGFAQIDHEREKRCGSPEVIYGAGKTPEQIIRISSHMQERKEPVLITRADDVALDQCEEAFPGAVIDRLAGICRIGARSEHLMGNVLVVTAGTSDLSVAREAKETLVFLGADPELISDVGVAGIHRLFAHHSKLTEADVVIVVAGMEGALASVVGGLISRPVIAVPTSVGYGANLQGITTLLAMASACASGITVTNVDNGFGAACAAARILRLLPGGDSPSRS